MSDAFFYADGADRKGPVDLATLQRLVADGSIARDANVWRQGVDTPLAAHAVAEFVGRSPAPPPAPPPAGIIRSIGAKIAAAAGVPQPDDVPVGSLFFGGDDAAVRVPDEDVFSVGTSTTTPDLASVPAGWPRPRVFWRVLVGALLTYFLLRVGMTEFENLKFVPGLIVVGAFGVPLAVVVFFFEMNSPRNVSIYQVAKMVLLGGAAGLVATMFIGQVVPGSGVGSIVPALLTAAVEETGKMLALVLVVRSSRWPWQLNGLLFGAAVGAGFAGFESAGYALEAGLRGGSVFGSIMWRALLSPGGHVIWTAMIAGAIWQVRGTKRFDLSMLLHKTVIHRWAVAVVLHGVWDALFFPQAELLMDAALLLIGWYVLFAVFKLAVAEVAAAKAAQTPAPSRAADPG